MKLVVFVDERHVALNVPCPCRFSMVGKYFPTCDMYLLFSLISRVDEYIPHRIHGTGIFIYIYHKSKPNVVEYTSPMYPTGTYIYIYHNICPKASGTSWIFWVEPTFVYLPTKNPHISKKTKKIQTTSKKLRKCDLLHWNNFFSPKDEPNFELGNYQTFRWTIHWTLASDLWYWGSDWDDVFFY